MTTPDGAMKLSDRGSVPFQTTTPRSFAVAQGGASFDYTLPGSALATFTWRDSPALDDGRVLVDAHGTTATALPAGDAGNAVDDDATTRWTTGAAQEPGQVDVPPTSARFRRVVQTASAPQWWSVADLRVYG